MIKKQFFEGWLWFKFSNCELVLGMTLKFYISVAKELKLKARNLKKELIILTLGEVTGGKPVEGVYAPHPE